MPTSEQPETTVTDNRQAILEEINGLLETDGDIDEARAKRLRKAVDALREPDAAAAVTGEAPADQQQLDNAIDSGLKSLRKRVHRQVERRNRDYEKALGLMGELEKALSDNELQHAEQVNHRLRSIMGNVPDRSAPRWRDIDKRLHAIHPQLRKLESWRHWGTTQAREQLIEQVMLLQDAGLPPDELAREIQQAREQWHSWDKSGDHAAKALWKRFDEACETAYKPCITHFEKLKKRRAANLKQRQGVIDRLNARYAATDWKQPDWRDLDKFVSHARRDFYKAGGVDFRHRKPLARAFEQALAQFEEQLERERSRSLRAREKLIADVEALAGVENLHEALEQLEALKRQWKITVVSKRGVENSLWKRYQAACDLTYSRRDAERREQAVERSDNLKQKQALIEELERTANSGDEELLASASALARARERWEAIGWVPRKQERSLNSRWHEAQKQFRRALAAARSRARSSELDNLARRAALCQDWEQAVLAGEAPDAAAAAAEWNALPALNGAHAGAMEQRFSQALTRPDDATLAENLAAKQAACLKLEVLLELDSPAECQAERMAYQIERLNASMKKDTGAQDNPDELLIRVLGIGAVPAEAAGAIEQRIRNCLACRTRHSK
jgi:exonuclease SbcC